MSSDINTLKHRVYYSQNREDLILESFFHDVQKGFYIDVGASDPEFYSVTKLFYEKGWNGINIEPIKHHYNALKTQRPRDINLNIGVGKKNETMIFYEYTSGDGLSTFSPEMVEKYTQLDEDVYKHRKEYKVKTKTLRDVLKAERVDKIHFLKVDVEGFEYDVLVGNDWNVYRPEVICIEANHIMKDWRPLLRESAYKLAFFDGLNEYYVDSKTSRLAEFDFVGNIVLNKDGGIRHSDYRLVAELDEKLKESQKALDEARQKLKTATLINASQEEAHQQLLHENHHNYVRAAVAENALNSPKPFIKYQIKHIHRIILRKLSAKKANLSYTKEEQDDKTESLNKLDKATTDEQRLRAVQKLARTETKRLERIYRMTNHQSIALKSYLWIVKSMKRLRMRRIK